MFDEENQVEEPVLATEKAAEEAPVEIVNVAVAEAEAPSTNEEGQTVITGPKKEKSPRVSNMHTKEDNVVGSRAADRALKNKKAAPKKEKSNDKTVAVWSDKNIRWTGVGTLTKGYNIVSEEAANEWLKKEGIRKATPEEVAAYFGK